MHFRLLFIAAVVCCVAPAAHAQVVSIGAARQQGSGATVTVEGVVSRASGAMTYVQDATGGLAVRQGSGAFYDAVLAGTIRPGCRLTLRGTLSSFNNLLQINGSGLQLFVVGACESPPVPQSVSLAELALNGEAYESELVRITGLSFPQGSPGRLSDGVNYTVSDATLGSFVMRLPSYDSEATYADAPPPPFTFEGVVGQFSDFQNTSSGYQLTVLGVADVMSASGVPPTVSYSFYAGQAYAEIDYFLLQLRTTRPVPYDIAVQLTKTSGTAIEGVDYVLPPRGQLVLPAGNRTALVRIGAPNYSSNGKSATFALSVPRADAVFESSAPTLTVSNNISYGSSRKEARCPSLTGSPLIACLRSEFARPRIRFYSSHPVVFLKHYPEADPARAERQLLGFYGARAGVHSLQSTGELATDAALPAAWMPDASSQLSDAHNLFPAESDAVAARGGRTFGTVSDAEALGWFGPNGQTGTPASGTRHRYSRYSETRFEPRDSVKGDVARALAYMYAMYGVTPSQQAAWNATKEVLLAWHRLDPADGEEFARADAIFAYQGNRNPFILDSTLLIRAIYPEAVAGEPLSTPEQMQVRVGPQPVRGMVQFTLSAPVGPWTVEVYDLLGRRVAHAEAVGTNAEVDLRHVPAGTYLYRVTSERDAHVAPFAVVR